MKIDLTDEEMREILIAIERVREEEGEDYWQHPNIRSVRAKLGQPSRIPDEVTA